MESGKFDIPEIPDIPELDDEEAGARGGGGGGGGRSRRRGLGGGGRGAGGGGGPRWWLWLVAGIVVGVAGTLFLPSLVAPYLPAVLRPDRQEVRGLVLQKSMEGERLLLTVESERGSMLATFREQVSELNLLVAEGDSITLILGEYRPFVDDPSVRGVRRNPGSAGRGATPTDTAGSSPDASARQGETGGAGQPAGGGAAPQDTTSRGGSATGATGAGGGGAADPGRQSGVDTASADRG